MRYIDQTVLIVGASGGIGAALAAQYSKEGARLVLCDRVAPTSAPEEARFTHVDVIDPSSMDSAVALALSWTGRIDVLVNAAGVVSRGSAAALSWEEWNRVLAINLTGTFIGCQAAIKAMKPRGYGRILNLGSVLGKNGGNARPWVDPAEQNGSGNVAYGVSKAGVHALTAYLAREVAAFGITVNALAPGPISTAMTVNLTPAIGQMIPVGRLGNRDDVVNAALFLTDPASSFVTGEVLDVNGGMWCD